MNQKEIIDFVSGIEFFETLDVKEMEQLSEKIVVQTFNAGLFLFKETKKRTSVHIIYAGDIELVKKTPKKEQKRLAYFSMGDIVGEGAFIDDTPHSTSARTVTPCTVFTIDRAEIEKLFKENPALGMTKKYPTRYIMVFKPYGL